MMIIKKIQKNVEKRDTTHQHKSESQRLYEEKTENN